MHLTITHPQDADGWTHGTALGGQYVWSLRTGDTPPDALYDRVIEISVAMAASPDYPIAQYKGGRWQGGWRLNEQERWICHAILHIE